MGRAGLASLASRASRAGQAGFAHRSLGEGGFRREVLNNCAVFLFPLQDNPGL